MKLNENGLRNREIWESRGYALPKFDRAKMIEETKENPVWVHFGAGNIFRAFHAAAAQKLLNEGIMDRGIIVAEGFDYEIIEKEYRPNDNYSILVTLKSDGSIERTVVGSIAESCILDSGNAAEFGHLREIFRKDSLQLCSFTITEKGYLLVNAARETQPAVQADFQNGPGRPESYIGKVAALLYERFLAGAKPVAMVSTDNCSHNGDRLHAAMSAFAEAWERNGRAKAGFAAYVSDRTKVSFPWSMIDKITPRPDASVEELLKRDGLEELEPVITSKNTYVAPFVNAEETEYLVIEDAFPNGRPALERAGILFTDRETVDKVEQMKVCTCLNPLHTALAVFGCLLGYTRISEEMRDAELVSLVRDIGRAEGLPVVTDPGVLDPGTFLDTVLNVRLPNPFMPDTPQRIASDTSQKLAIRFGETLKNYRKTGRDPALLRKIPLVFAGWLRYLMAVDDEGETFALSPDPMVPDILDYVSGLKLGERFDPEPLRPLLADASVFGVDLWEYGLAERVLGYLEELTAGVHAVRETLRRYA
ncbi:mannitol dehydrogenase family protein [Lachnoclostridium sp. Marseille-P6806]|uniref:mannitol dehydrogenase family protein n=1 Tax=Lachnoclostridium sp. Marseille-P6806 TaxID=2364793 RepID=UPI00102F8110|nr:mannitol dehydrogenase family protein [Lachnoclostridium sp. Marseille-P6806]